MAILVAAENGKLTELKQMLDANPHLINTVDEDGYGCLHRAAYNNHVPVIEELIGRGANVNLQTNEGWTPLHSAAHWNNFASASILLHAGSDPNIKTKGGNTALHVASLKQPSSETLQLLIWWPFSNWQVSNESEDTAIDIAQRNGKYHGLFEAKQGSVNVI